MKNYERYLPSEHKLFDRDRFNRALVFDFLLVFSRLEYALKAAGYVRQGRQEEPVIKWTDFTQELQGKLSFAGDNTLSEAPRKPRRPASVSARVLRHERGSGRGLTMV